MSFPNPAMLPFFAAGGAISGSSFGLFYTILMQVGYNYYGKRVLKGLNEGRDLRSMLWEVQQEVQPFSDAMMQMALDAMPSVIERSMDAFANIIEKTGGHVMSELAKSWLLPHPPRGGLGIDFSKIPGNALKELQTLFPSMLEAGAVHSDVIDTTISSSDKELGYDASKGRIHFYKGKYYTQQRLQQLIDVKQRSSTVSTAKQADVSKFQSLAEKSRPAGQRLRKAGQSQIMEKKRLLSRISGIDKIISSFGNKKHSQGAKRAMLKKKVVEQQKLALLLQRYRF